MKSKRIAIVDNTVDFSTGVVVGAYEQGIVPIWEDVQALLDDPLGFAWERGEEYAGIIS